MSTTTTKRLPSRVAWVFGSISLVLGVTAAEYIEAGPVWAVVGTAVSMLLLALAYEFVFA
ncbi:hypothetical protein [Natrialba taiwanensis]|uniref:hypothetical protein n=1 Tax=Natrialba taiwanensis TaxID=160846 RepID=UPI0012682295|nr:hypothetical protein [Natrialba taiwanensis]